MKSLLIATSLVSLAFLAACDGDTDNASGQLPQSGPSRDEQGPVDSMDPGLADPTRPPPPGGTSTMDPSAAGAGASPGSQNEAAVPPSTNGSNQSNAK